MTPGLNVQAADVALADEVDRMARGTTDSAAAVAGSRRLSGSAWQPSLPIPEVDPAGTAVLPVAVRRPRRRRQRWYRRKLVLIPTILALLIAGVTSAMLLRAGSTIAELQQVSTPPPSVALQDDVGQPEIQVDTAAAAAAVREAQAARGEQQDDGGSLFGDFKDKAGDVGDVAGGAAAAAGLTNPETGTINVLVMGVDARPGAPIDIAVKADAILVLHLNPETKSCRILSIPRDTRTELPGYGQSKVNHALLVGGIPYQQLVVEKMLGITMDHYALIDMAGFEELVDAVGGVTVNVTEDITVKGTQGSIELKKGVQQLDGSAALGYARNRTGPEGDIGRIKRQWSVMRGLVLDANGRDLARDVNQLLPAVENHIRTDLSATDMVAIAKTFGSSCTDQTMGTAVLAGSQVRLQDPMLKQTVYYNLVDEPVIRQRVAELVA